MNRKLFKQIRNEWRSNLWILVELLIVSVVMWFIADFMYVRITDYNSPRGFDISHCYLIKINKLTPNSPDFNPSDTLEKKDMEELLNRLQHGPEIEAASLSQNSYPYNGSNASIGINYDTIQTGSGSIIRRWVTPDFVKVFRYEGANGESPEQLAELLKHDNILISDNIFIPHKILSLHNYIGKSFKLSTDTTRSFRLGAALKPIKYYDFESGKDSYCCLYKMDMNHFGNWCELCVRVKEKMDNNFMDNLWKDADKHLRVGNLYVSDIKSFSDIRTNFQRSQMNDMRNHLVGGAFLMLNIFLGILGTFWFRTQQRKGEIALFKALGSTNKDIFRREIIEGLILLSVATIFAIIIDLNMAYANLNEWHDGVTLESGRFIFSVLISYLLIALMIVIGIWFPAKKAMKIQPAEALHEE